jgi:carbamoyl-phosphate synthase large subunit
MVSDKSVIDIAEDKWLTYEKLTGMGFHVPFTLKLASAISQPPLPYPFIIKPYLGGARSKDVYLVKTEAEYTSILEKIKGREADFITQEYLAGEEYTCGTVTLGGICHGTIVMKRELRAGDTYKCQSIESPVISTTLVHLMNKLQPFGACNVQLKLKDGLPYIFEINARCSGTTAARALCGFNEPKMVADYLLQGAPPQYAVKSKTILRYWKELEVENETVAEMAADGHLSLKAFTPL